VRARRPREELNFVGVLPARISSLPAGALDFYTPVALDPSAASAAVTLLRADECPAYRSAPRSTRPTCGRRDPAAAQHANLPPE